MSGRDGPRLWGSGRWSVGDQKNRLQPAHGCSIGLFGEGKSEIPDHLCDAIERGAERSLGRKPGVARTQSDPVVFLKRRLGKE